MAQIPSDPAFALSAKSPMAISAVGVSTPEIDAFAALLATLDLDGGGAMPPVPAAQAPQTPQAPTQAGAGANAVPPPSDPSQPPTVPEQPFCIDLAPWLLGTNVPLSTAAAVTPTARFQAQTDAPGAPEAATKTDPAPDAPAQDVPAENPPAGMIGIAAWVLPPPVPLAPESAPAPTNISAAPLDGPSQIAGDPTPNNAPTPSADGGTASQAAPTQRLGPVAEASVGNQPPAALPEIAGPIGKTPAPPGINVAPNPAGPEIPTAPLAAVFASVSAPEPQRTAKVPPLPRSQTPAAGPADHPSNAPLPDQDVVPSVNAKGSPAVKPASLPRNMAEDTPPDFPAPKGLPQPPGAPPEAPVAVPTSGLNQHAVIGGDATLAPPANPPQAAAAASMPSGPMPMPSAPHAPDAYATPVPISGLAVEIAARLREGKQRFEIRLDPPELGRIDVRLDLDQHGHVSSRLIVERSETLDLLRRDAPSLERALQSAGLKTDGGIDFSLRDQTFARHREAPEANTPSRTAALPDEEPAPAVLQRGYWRWRGLGGDLDIRV